MNRYCILIIVFFASIQMSLSQAVPAEDENIPHLITFGNKSDLSWGDDDFSQVFFFVVPKTNDAPFFLRIFDPDTGNDLDELKGEPNTTTRFSVYGGKGTITTNAAKSTDPTFGYNSGTLLAYEQFSDEATYNNTWFSFGPFNPSEGEYAPEYGGYVFKLIADGVSGNDGNIYNYFMSLSKTENKPIEGGNAFTFEYSFRMHDDESQVSHIYPYIDDKAISIKQGNFDYDNDGLIRIVSVARTNEYLKISGDNEWKFSEHLVYPAEKGNSLDIQFIKKKPVGAKNNNIVFYITNQFGEFLPFYTVPIGGIPKYKYKINYSPVK